MTKGSKRWSEGVVTVAVGMGGVQFTVEEAVYPL